MFSTLHFLMVKFCINVSSISCNLHFPLISSLLVQLLDQHYTSLHFACSFTFELLLLIVLVKSNVECFL